MRLRRWLTPALLLCSMTASGSDNSEISRQHQFMLDAIRHSVRESADYTGRTELSDRVMRAMATVPLSLVSPLSASLSMGSSVGRLL